MIKKKFKSEININETPNKKSKEKKESSAPTKEEKCEDTAEKKEKKKFYNPAVKGTNPVRYKGEKEKPIGEPMCLKDKTFVITGVLNYIEREEAEDLIKEYGGKVTSAVSGKTNYLLAGYILEDSRPVEDGGKYKKAKEKNVKIIDDDFLYDLINKSFKGEIKKNNKEEVNNTSKKEEINKSNVTSSNSVSIKVNEKSTITSTPGTFLSNAKVSSSSPLKFSAVTAGGVIITGSGSSNTVTSTTFRKNPIGKYPCFSLFFSFYHPIIFIYFYPLIYTLNFFNLHLFIKKNKIYYNFRYSNVGR